MVCPDGSSYTGSVQEERYGNCPPSPFPPTRKPHSQAHATMCAGRTGKVGEMACTSALPDLLNACEVFRVSGSQTAACGVFVIYSQNLQALGIRFGTIPTQI